MVFEGNEFEATYAYSSFWLYKFWISETTLSYPYLNKTEEEDALLIFLLISYSKLKFGENPEILFKVNCFNCELIEETIAFSYAIVSEFLNKISTLSPTLMLDLSKKLFNSKVVPLILSIWNLQLVLYIQEFEKISL